jgi:AcrR family transcriptional regulator
MPRQTRALATRAAILEAAAQILERDGLAGFTTNAVAARAGVSIGTLYQYFDDKDALLLTIAREEMARAGETALRLLADGRAGAIEDRVRATIRALIHAFGGRQRARKAVVQAVLARGLGEAFLAPINRFTDHLAERFGGPDGPVQSRRERAFVLSRAVLGTIRAAVLEEVSFFKSRAFEDELVRLVMAYLAARPVPG